MATLATTSTYNNAMHLRRMAQTKPDQPAVVCQRGGARGEPVYYRTLTFAELDEMSDRAAWGLQRAGIQRGMRTVLMVKPSPEFFILTFGLFKVGAVIVMIDPGIGRKNLGKCLQEAEPEAFVGITAAHVARVILGWGRGTVRKLVTVGTRLFWGGAGYAGIVRTKDDAPFPMVEAPLEEVAAILFTSGSTGVPKGAVYTQGVFAAQVAFLQENFQFEGNEVDLATFPLFALFDPALGMTAVIPDMNASKPAQADPAKLIRAIEDHGVSQMFGSPALIDRLSRYAEQNDVRFPTLKRVLSAGAPVRPDILERMMKRLPEDALFYTPYGATESLPVALIEGREILGETRRGTAEGGGTCVGRPVPQVGVRLIRITDEPIERWSDDLLAGDGEVGEIVVDGPVVTQSYYGRPDSTRLAKIRKPDGSGVMHRMGDLGRWDEQGRLWFCGRKTHRVRTAEGPLFTIPCEGVFNEHPRVFRTALVGIGDPNAQTPVICVQPEGNPTEGERIQIGRELMEMAKPFEHTRSIQRFLFHDAFPVDIRHNAKINREALARWAAERTR